MTLPPIIWGGAAGAVVALMLAGPTATSLGQLASARAELAALRDMASAPAVARRLVPDEVALAQPDADRQLIAHLRALATKSGALVESSVPAGSPGVARVRLRLSGSSDAVIGAVDAIERGRPLVRLSRWRIEAAAGSVRLQGEAVAPWR